MCYSEIYEVLNNHWEYIISLGYSPVTGGWFAAQLRLFSCEVTKRDYRLRYIHFKKEEEEESGLECA